MFTVDRRAAAVVALPILVPTAMAGLFRALVRACGPRLGYRLGFAGYWATCLAVPPLLLGRRRLRSVFARPSDAVGSLTLQRLILLVPPAGGILTQLMPACRVVTPRLLATATALAAINATAEELLWRGLPAAYFPDAPGRGWLWPAAGFWVWHLVPLSVSKGRPGPLLAGAALIGLGYGWVAWSDGSVRRTLPPHILTDASGVRAWAGLWLSGVDPIDR